MPGPTCNVPVGVNPLCTLFLTERTLAHSLCSQEILSPSEKLAKRVFQQSSCRGVLAGHNGVPSKAVAQLSAAGDLLYLITVYFPHLIEVYVRPAPAPPLIHTPPPPRGRHGFSLLRRVAGNTLW